jgi:hypothetical protein
MSRQTPPTDRIVDRLRQPEYTGENRCTPCTVVNVAIAAVGSALLAAVALPLGVVAFVGGLLAIYLRGYLVPYTPAITKRYFPDRVLRWFDKTPEPGGERVDVEEREELDVERTLYDLGVVTECAKVDDLCLDDRFQRRWRERIDAVDDRDVEAAVRRLLDLDPDAENEVERRGREAAVVLIDGLQVGQWESHAALVADLAADEVLREWTDDWDDYHPVNRSEILNSLRMFMERCSECGDPVSVDQETVESCCRSFDVAAVTCDGCGSRFFEIELTDELRRQI